MVTGQLIAIPTWGSINLLQIIWTAIGVVGFVSVIPGFRDILKNMDAIFVENTQYFKTPAERQAALIITKNYIRHELLRAFEMLLIILVGIIAMTTTPAPRAVYVTLTGLFITIAFFGIAGSAATHSMLDYRQRRQARAVLAAMNGNGKEKSGNS